MVMVYLYFFIVPPRPVHLHVAEIIVNFYDYDACAHRALLAHESLLQKQL